MARMVMLAMHRDDVILLSPPTQAYLRPKPALTFGPGTEPLQFPLPTDLDAVCPLALCIVGGDTPESRLWNEFIARDHTLRHQTLADNPMRTLVTDRTRAPLALLGCSTAASTLAPLDQFIGWAPQTRENNLRLIVDNPRFLILP